MSLFITSLNSGSNGNCYYIGSDQEAVLVDAGISCRETEKRMERLELTMERVKAIFVSHEHTDHISGIPVLAKKYGLPVYITEGTLRQGRLRLEPRLVYGFRAHDPVSIGGLTVTAFSKFHDACDPHSFTVESAQVKVGVFTDIGVACPQVVRHFRECHAAFLEANYDKDMLLQGSYPYHLKQRIMGGKGHLSNAEALQLVKQHKPLFMSHLLLSHLSKNNNCPRLVEDLFSRNVSSTQVVVASRYAETPVYHITASCTLPISHPRRKQPQKHAQQLSLF